MKPSRFLWRQICIMQNVWREKKITTIIKCHRSFTIKMHWNFASQRFKNNFLSQGPTISWLTTEKNCKKSDSHTLPWDTWVFNQMVLKTLLSHPIHPLPWTSVMKMLLQKFVVSKNTHYENPKYTHFPSLLPPFLDNVVP